MAQEKKAPEAKAAEEQTAPIKPSLKKRLALALSLILLLISGMSVGVFCVRFSAKTLSAPTPPPKLPDIEAMRKIRRLNGEAASILSNMRQYRDGDGVRIVDKTTPRGLTSGEFYLYLIRKGEEITARLVIGGVVDRGLLADGIDVEVDPGEERSLDIGNDRVAQVDLAHLTRIGMTYEFVDLRIDDCRDIVRRVCDSRRALVNIKGDDSRHAFRLSYDQINAIRRVFSLYNIYEELNETALRGR